MWIVFVFLFYFSIYSGEKPEKTGRARGELDRGNGDLCGTDDLWRKRVCVHRKVSVGVGALLEL